MSVFDGLILLAFVSGGSGICLLENTRHVPQTESGFDYLVWEFNRLSDCVFVPEANGMPGPMTGIDREKLVKESYACTACEAGVNLGSYLLSQGKTDQEFIRYMEEFCIGINFRTPKQCRELTNLVGPEIIDILLNATISPSAICTFVENTKCGEGFPPSHQWTVQLPLIPKPTVVPPKPPKPDTPKLKVLHISDTHFDPMFKEGTKDVCKDPICCREETGYPEEGESAAGKWGGWQCDIPEITLDNMLQHIVATHTDIDYIIWTGDLPPHATWSQTVDDSIYSLNATVAKVWQYFPQTPVFPTVGNHEPSPPHNFPSPVLGNENVISWFYDALVKNWAVFLPNTTFPTIERAGFYVAQARPGLKIVSLNTNFCYFNNWWLILNSTDPADQLKWFAEQLQEAETNNEKVHVIAHIPPGYYDCIQVFSENYYKIVSRYESTVTAQFFGHTHTDEIEIYYDTVNTSRPSAVAYVAPAASTHTFMNPGYRLYLIDGDHQETERYVYEAETWVMNLTEANLNDNPVWYKMYSAREAYDMPSLLPEDWNNFYERLETDDNLLNLYDKHYRKDPPNRADCGDSCRKTRLCDIRSCIHYGEPN